jgi:hypothetical protein
MQGSSFPGATPLAIRILGGLFRITHIKQFISFGVSICVLLWIIRVIHFRTFILVVLFGFLAILVLSLIDPFLSEPMPDPEHVRLLDSASPFIGASFETSLFSSGPFKTLNNRSSDTKCSICDRPFFADDETTLTNCRHLFHRRCFEEWTSVDLSCPECQTSLT